jgi:hypothetical protein
MMDEGANYYKDGATRVLELMRDTFGGKFRAYFDGEAEPGENWLPCMMVMTPRVGIQSGATGTDDLTEQIIIIISLSAKDDVGASPEVQLTDYKLRKYIFGQDPNTGQYLPQTVLGALRTHYTLSDAVIESDVEFEIGPNVRGTAEQPVNTREAFITVNLKRLATVPART